MAIYTYALLQIAILAYAVLGGVFLAFSDFIMRSLTLSHRTGGVEAMQTINREVFRGVFMVLFLGMTAVSLLTIYYAAFAHSGWTRTLIAMSGLVYLLGCFGVTIVCNVPMNNILARMDLASDTTLNYWADVYLPRWTFWNTIRTLACCLSSALLLFGFTRMLSSVAQG